MENFSGRPAAPSVKPDCYPDSILWTLADAKKDASAFSAKNQSRPSMKHCIRHEDGSEITHEEWRDIRRSARFAIGRFLNSKVIGAQPLIPHDNRKSFFREHHSNEWLGACYALESAHKIVSLCAGNWKAEHILSSLLTSKRSAEKRAAKRKEINTSAAPSSSSSDDEMSSAATTDAASGEGSKESAKRRVAELQVPAHKKSKKHSRDSIRSKDTANKRSKLSMSTVALEAQITASIGNPVSSGTNAAVSTDCPKIDTLFIYIDPESMAEIFFLCLSADLMCHSSSAQSSWSGTSNFF